MPNEELVKARAEYIKVGSVGDTTPPPAATHLKLNKRILTWEAEADFESGIQQFIILRDGQEIGRVPEKPSGKFGRKLFQGMSYGDTPEKPLTEMRFADKASAGDVKAYRVISVNSVGLPSE